MSKPTVSVINCPDYDPARVEASVRRAVDLIGGMDSFIRPGSRVLIKPNMLVGKPPEKAVTTHPEVLRAVIRLVKGAGGLPVIGDSNAIGNFRKVAETTGIATVAHDEGTELIELSEAVSVAGSGVFKQFEISRQIMEADHVINLPKAKTHGQMLLTMAVKNLFGCIPGRRKAQWHFKAGVDRNAFATMLVELFTLVKPTLNIVDAVVGMEGNGPGSGTPRQVGLIVAGADAVSVDIVLCGILGVQPDRLPTYKVAVGMGLTPTDGIELVGDYAKIDRPLVAGFKLPSESNLEWTIPEPVRRVLKDALTTRPSVDAEKCVRCLMCKTACPAEAIREADNTIAFDYRKCIRCFCCQEVCPVGAIDIVEGWLLKVMG